MVVPFYTELKSIRQEQEIDLSEVANRTKINMSYLESLESGDFSFLPTVYIRLFLRAYAVEIGANAQDSLKQLDIHLAKTEEMPQPQPATVEDHDGEEDEETYAVSRKTPFQIRSDILKVVVLVAIVLFAIFIIRRIITEEPMAPAEVTDARLEATYTRELSQETIAAEPPYRFTLRATAPLWCKYSLDNAEYQSETLDDGEDIRPEFQSGFQLRADPSSSVELVINDHPVIFDATSHHVDFTFQSRNGELTITHYRLK
ncbi:MAG: helix-turn-helix transcriptional regulator [Candidatus Neomarinimicrobiota bacterium]